MKDKDFMDFIDAVLPKASEEQIASALPKLIEEANRECAILAQIDPIAHPIGEA